MNIPLTNTNQFAIIDDNDAELVLQYRWFLKKANWCSYVATSVRKGEKVKTILLHRLIMNPERNEDVHHRFGNTLDNRRENLEIVSHYLRHIRIKEYK